MLGGVRATCLNKLDTEPEPLAALVKAVTYADNVGVIALLQATQRAIATRTVVKAYYQFCVWRICQGECKIKAQIEKHLRAALMIELMQGFLTYWI